MWTQVRRLEHTVFLWDDKSMKEMLRKHSVQSPLGTLRLFCSAFVCICSLRSPPFKKILQKKQCACLHFRSSKWGRYEDRARSLRPLQPAPLLPKSRRAWDSKAYQTPEVSGARMCAGLKILPRWLSCLLSLPAPSWEITILIHIVKPNPSSLREACG